jgi:hypothetical protein
VFKFLLGECVIETGLFIFNTEAHPVDGASLECCRVQRHNKAKDKKSIDMELYEFLDIDQILDRYVRLSSRQKNRSPNRPRNLTSTKEEYLAMQEKMKEEFKLDELRVKLFCDSLFTNETQKSRIDFVEEKKSTRVNQFPFTCSLNNSFRVRTHFLSSLSNFP